MISKDVLGGAISELDRSADTIEHNIRQLLENTPIQPIYNQTIRVYYHHGDHAKRDELLQRSACQRRSKNAHIRRNESAQIYKYLPPSVSLTLFLNSYVGVSLAFFVP
jgi:hypothetical protein